MGTLTEESIDRIDCILLSSNNWQVTLSLSGYFLYLNWAHWRCHRDPVAACEWSSCSRPAREWVAASLCSWWPDRRACCAQSSTAATPPWQPGCGPGPGTVRGWVATVSSLTVKLAAWNQWLSVAGCHFALNWGAMCLVSSWLCC